MELHFAKRMESFQPGIFNVLNDKKNELLKAGRTVYNLSVGTPDFLPDENVMRAMQEACKDPDNYKYSLGNLPELVEAVQNWYQRRYGVALDPEEIILGEENRSAMEAHIKKELSEMERSVLELYLTGMSYGEIAERLDRPLKSIDNALQRIKTKLSGFLR